MNILKYLTEFFHFIVNKVYLFFYILEVNIHGNYIQ